MKIVVVGLVAVLLVLYAATSPGHAADVVHHVWHFLVGIAHGIGSFVDHVAS